MSISSITISPKTVVIVAGIALLLAIVGIALGAAGLASKKPKQGTGPQGPQGIAGPPGPPADVQQLPLVSARLSADGNLKAGSQTVVFDTVDYGNQDGAYNTKTGIYTPTQTGYYFVNFSLSCSSTASPMELAAKIFVGNSMVEISNDILTNSGKWNVVGGSKTIKIDTLSPANTISIVATAGASIGINSDFGVSFFQVTYIRGI